MAYVSDIQLDRIVSCTTILPLRARCCLLPSHRLGWGRQPRKYGGGDCTTNMRLDKIIAGAAREQSAKADAEYGNREPTTS
eukprot:CAMPEP_0180491762 /NCGR_PEP_ID=MMETSP1036_2-20121128/39820_1 /TAXON_ID=632150 /ORGANISM="Azadinium spinosum, Strain 3D9" /LENGTH=80 /DNA_ID=CAMNT_0022500041 /DNA_START=327 /DNA_END=569 /DNA_ORIENTATION=+